MSLAMTAATIEDNDNGSYNNLNDTPVNKKRQSHNKTQKRNVSTGSAIDMNKVNNVLHSIHNRVADDDETEANYIGSGIYEKAQHSEAFKPLNPFNPPDKPISMGTERTKLGIKEGLSNLVPQPADNEELSLYDLQSSQMNDSQIKDFYKRVMPNQYVPHKQPNYTTGSQPVYSDNQVLIDKINYMINLLEEQQDIRTNNVTEEVVLYSFLGVFIIFIVDSFARVGKYVR